MQISKFLVLSYSYPKFLVSFVVILADRNCSYRIVRRMQNPWKFSRT